MHRDDPDTIRLKRAAHVLPGDDAGRPLLRDNAPDILGDWTKWRRLPFVSDGGSLVSRSGHGAEYGPGIATYPDRVREKYRLRGPNPFDHLRPVRCAGMPGVRRFRMTWGLPDAFMLDLP